jgi:TRAP-type C4-dicarboxylate transport system permease small subunit
MERWLKRLCYIPLIIAGTALAFQLVFTVANVVMRGFQRPIVGDLEVISLLGAVVIGGALPHTTILKGHVAVDFLLEKLPRGVGHWLESVTGALNIALYGLIGWNLVIMSFDLIKSGEVTAVFRLPFYPISFGLALCCFLQCLVYILRVKRALGGCHE